jgi:hypothetical protein
MYWFRKKSPGSRIATGFHRLGVALSARFLLVAVAVLALTCIVTVRKSDAGSLVTISCDKPSGFSMEYGISSIDRLRAKIDNEPEPTKPTLKGPTKDSLSIKPTFVIDSNKKKITVIWNELTEDAALRKKAKEEAGFSQTPPAPAGDGVIVQFLRDKISAIQAEPWTTTMYSFFPTVGTAFISVQNVLPGSKNTMQMAYFAHCDFFWSNPQ